MKKSLTIVLLVVLLISLCTPAYAAMPDESILEPQYLYVRSTYLNLSIDPNTGIADCEVKCVPDSGYTVEITCKLQRFTGNSWATQKTWRTTGLNYAEIIENWAVYSGYTYRLDVIFRIRNAEGKQVEIFSENYSCDYPKN